MTTKLDVYQIVTDRILALLEQGTIPWQKPWGSAQGGIAPTNFVSKRPYRGMNVFLLSCSGFGCPYWVSFKQAKELGGSIRKGEHGFPVIFWQRKERKDDDGNLIYENGKPTFYMVLRYYTVFNLEQTEGIKWEKPEPVSGDFGTIAACERIVENMPQRPAIRHKGDGAYYSPMLDLVNMPPRESFTSGEAYYSTLFHELVHATGHASRLNRKGVSNEVEANRSFGSGDYGREELVAEMGAAFLCGASGIINQSINNSAAYLKSWIKTIKEDNKIVVIAAAQAQKAADFILGTKFGAEE